MSERPTNCCKVGRIAHEDDIEEWTADLVSDWQDGTSLRSLANRFNKRVIDVALDNAASTQSEWIREPIYDLFLGGTTDQSNEIEIRRELQRAELDVDGLKSDLISHQTLYRHFTQCLDESKDTSRSSSARLESARDTIFSLQRRTQQVTESTISNLRQAEIVDIGDSDVIVDIQVVCEKCGRSMDVETTLSEGCDC